MNSFPPNSASRSLALVAVVAMSAACQDAASQKEEYDCAPEVQYFEAHVWPTLDNSCYGCHNKEGLAAGTRLVLDREKNASNNLLTVRTVARDNTQGASLLLLKPTALSPAGHTGGAILRVDEPAYKLLEQLVMALNAPETCEAIDAQAVICAQERPGARLLRRLTEGEFNRSVRRVFSLDLTTWPDATFPPVSQPAGGHRNDADELKVDAGFIQTYHSIIESTAAAVISSDGLAPYLQPDCTMATVDQGCLQAAVPRLGRNIHRRPLTPAEVTEYIALYNSVLTKGTSRDGLQWIVVAMLGSPDWLFRLELGELAQDGTYHLSPYELATALSFSLTGATPTESLLRQAESGDLDTLDSIQQVAGALLQSAEGRDHLVRFFEDWMHYQDIAHVLRRTQGTPFTPQVGALMAQETTAYLEHWLASADPSLASLWTADHTFVNQQLADYYGYPGSFDETLQITSRPTGSGVGLLGQGSFLALHAASERSSPTLRGLEVLRLLCQTLPGAPPVVPALPATVETDTTRELFEKVHVAEGCAGCHDIMDPIGFAFEHFDAGGKYRSTENGHPIDSSGHMVRLGYEFSGQEELASVLVHGPEATECFTQNLASWMFGLSRSELGCTIHGVAEGFVAGGKRIDTLSSQLTATRHFRQRTAGPAKGCPSVAAGGENTASGFARWPATAAGTIAALSNDCAAGYEGRALRRCDDDGAWLDAHESCAPSGVETCPAVGAGQETANSGWARWATAPAGTVAVSSAQCRTGYEGMARRSCGPNGTWMPASESCTRVSGSSCEGGVLPSAGDVRAGEYCGEHVYADAAGSTWTDVVVVGDGHIICGSCQWTNVDLCGYTGTLQFNAANGSQTNCACCDR